jgi:hypothetical protein
VDSEQRSFTLRNGECCVSVDNGQGCVSVDRMEYRVTLCNGEGGYLETVCRGALLCLDMLLGLLMTEIDNNCFLYCQEISFSFLPL